MPRTSAELSYSTDHAARVTIERNGHCRFDGGNRGVQCGGLFEIALRLPSRQRKLILELPGGIRNLGLPGQQAKGGV